VAQNKIPITYHLQRDCTLFVQSHLTGFNQFYPRSLFKLSNLYSTASNFCCHPSLTFGQLDFIVFSLAHHDQTIKRFIIFGSPNPASLNSLMVGELTSTYK
jgi:hypothetical protein